MGSAVARAKYIDGAANDFGGLCKDGGGTYDCAGSGIENDLTVNTDGVLFPMSKVKIGQVVDGTSKTYLLGERWYQMRLWAQGANGALAAIGKPVRSDVWSCKNINPRIPINGDMKTIGWYGIGDHVNERPGPRTGSTYTYLSPSLPFGSFHPGGANFAYVDGSVHFETDDIEPALYIARGSRNGEETGQELLRVPVRF
jgi:prepilin-type processing-associated H-X9-DG protein